MLLGFCAVELLGGCAIGLLCYMLGCSGSWPVVFVGLLCCWGSCVCWAVVVFGLLYCCAVEPVVFVGSAVKVTFFLN